MYNMGFMYANGQGVAQDYQQAMAWSRKAADDGIAVAMYNIGVGYDHGQGVVQDYQQAMAWYRKAADAGDENAKKRLAELAVYSQKAG